ncbi:nucleolar protein 56-like isoform X2 [Argiope bruennichi]|uniref:nucleolar protein 56-like isoform X1 n=1 Tax=Argiope bruennichi TaxID=94029 RepID=UPI002494356A|nr:nucleolar protein 56-like isoform X1 [Argiope bruennichi]XP_055953255.1 nucleolar protein 56-like isoform X2 [Argiope bruennichi]
MTKLFTLYEHAAGYALFMTEQEEGILDEIRDRVLEVEKFKEICHFVAFQPFKRGRDALENINCISEGILHSHLEEFLANNFPKKKKKKHVLGVEDAQLASSIKEKLDITCDASDVVNELIRGIRCHFHNLVPGFNDLNAATKVQLGLGHAYSRAQVKFNVGRVDNMIIQTITLVDQMDKDINTLSMRVREWYSHHFPELIKIVPENTLYIQCINAIRDRKNLPEDIFEKLENILNDPVKVQNVLDVARSSMGMDISDTDLENMYTFAERVIALTERRKHLMDYLKSKMHCVAPNLAALIGEVVGARLIAQAGSLTNLAKAPASTVQILGAEKALFRALKTRGNTPKYGLLFHSKFIGKAAKSNKGRISRYLANKCSVATRIDCFREIPTEVFGNKLRAQVEDRLKFYETGEIPKKNIDVMDEALEEAEASEVEILKRMKKEKKKAKKRKLDELYLSTDLDESMGALAQATEANDGDSVVVKKKKKKKHNDAEEEMTNDISANESQEVYENSAEPPKKKKKNKHIVEENSILENGDVQETDSAKKKKKNKHMELSLS